MVITRHIPQREIDEIKHHIDLTADTLVKAYTLTQISVLDGIDTRTIKRSGKYIPVRVDIRETRYRYLKLDYKKPYTIKWIRVDEIIHIYDKRNKKKRLVEEYK